MAIRMHCACVDPIGPCEDFAIGVTTEGWLCCARHGLIFGATFVRLFDREEGLAEIKREAEAYETLMVVY